MRDREEVRQSYVLSHPKFILLTPDRGQDLIFLGNPAFCFFKNLQYKIQPTSLLFLTVPNVLHFSPCVKCVEINYRSVLLVQP